MTCPGALTQRVGHGWRAYGRHVRPARLDSHIAVP